MDREKPQAIEFEAGQDFPETADIETSSEEYAQRFAGDVGAWMLRVQEAATLSLLRPYQGGTILDVGGGHGQMVGPLLESGYRVKVTGSAHLCQRRIENHLRHPNCSFEVANVLDMPFPDQGFDVVLSYRLLPHVKQWEPFLGELARVARKAVIVDYPSTRSWNMFAGLSFGVKDRIEGNTRPFSCFSASDLQAALRPHGLVPDGRYPQFFIPMVVHRKMNSVRLSAALEKISRRLRVTDWFGSPVIQRFSRENES